MNAYLVSYGEMHKVKCNAAMQNFPYEKLPTRIHLVDWGCGQGVGSLCVLENLFIHGLLSRVKKITLIEPSNAALKRAEEYVKTAVKNFGIQVESFQKYLPSVTDTPNALSALEMMLPGTIHIFSNILDIPQVSLRKTAQIIENANGSHFVICTSPVNANSTRLDEFAQFFSSTETFSDISDRQYGMTSDTYHPFSCKTRCFYFKSTESHLSKDVPEGTYSPEGAYGDYDMEAMVRNGSLSVSLYKAYSALSSKLSDEDRIFLQPNLNGDTPDIVVVRPHKGILVLNVFDESPQDCIFNNGILKVRGNDVTSPLTRTYNYRNNIFEQHSSEIIKIAQKNKSAWYIVCPAVWFANFNRLQINALFAAKPGKNRNPNAISGVHTIDSDSILDNNIWDELEMNAWKGSFTDEACKEIIKVLTSQWHCCNEGSAEYGLTKKQEELSKSYSGRVKRVKGVAGSGKTHVLASTAVNCQLRTGRNVLILTYNITLANFIRYRMGLVPADFPWNKFTITNYHNFCKTQAINQNLQRDLNSFDNAGFFDEVSDKLPKYSAILIDEAQDYKTDWFTLLFNNFLEEDGEVVVFGDDKQDVYGRGTFNRIPSVRNHTWGPWTKLNIGHRVNNQHIVDLANAFQRQFFNVEEGPEGERELAFDGGYSYICLSEDATPAEIVENMLDYFEQENINAQDTVVLSQQTELLRQMESVYCTKTEESCTTTFETQEYYDGLVQRYQNDQKKIDEEIEQIRTNKKTHFSMDSGLLKLSTIYSYKGWEASCVVLVIQSERDVRVPSPELIYTAITRAKDRLLVINLGNCKYHRFFEEQSSFC